MTYYIFEIIKLLGGLALFLFGMDVMGKALERQAGGKLEAHEYLNALKAGELQESAVFSERFLKYKAQYAFPDEE